jgi:DNA replicative helicase MCM subunit Mcm2 (Cdc46/Mcm family)
MGKPSEEFMVLASQVNEIANEGAEDSKEVIDNLEKENEVLVTARREQMDKITVLMEEEVSVSLNTLAESTLPEDISAAQINSIIKIIE